MGWPFLGRSRAERVEDAERTRLAEERFRAEQDRYAQRQAAEEAAQETNQRAEEITSRCGPFRWRARPLEGNRLWGMLVVVAPVVTGLALLGGFAVAPGDPQYGATWVGLAVPLAFITWGVLGYRMIRGSGARPVIAGIGALFAGVWIIASSCVVAILIGLGIALVTGGYDLSGAP